jgi:hypothetical protein
MQYKNIVLKMLKHRPQMHDQLRKERQLLATMEQYARELKASHQAWIALLKPLRPGSNPILVNSEALELALKELEDRLPSVSPESEQESVFLNAAMLFKLRHSPRD